MDTHVTIHAAEDYHGTITGLDPEYASTTTLARIRAAQPCSVGWTKLLKGLGKTEADDEPLDLLTILDINGLNDALWVLSFGMPPEASRLARHFQAWCAEQVLPIFEAECPDDTRVRDQIAMLRNDDASDEDRDAARDAAWAAARAAASAAARGAARAAVSADAWGAARDAQERQLRQMLTAMKEAA